MTAESGETRDVTVLFADLSGFTAFSENADPETVRVVAEHAARRFGEIVMRADGVVDKVIGDCVMAIFDGPTVEDDDAVRAVRAALSIVQDVERNPRAFAGLGVSIGVMTGPAIYAPAGASGEFTVLGETVDLAAQLQSAARAGEILIGERTNTMVAASVRTEPAPPMLRGAAQVPSWRALADPAGPDRSVDVTARWMLEIDRLQELWERVDLDRRPILALLEGSEPDTRALARAFARQLPEAGILLVDLVSDRRDAIWAALVRSASSISPTDPAGVARGKLEALLSVVERTDAELLWPMVRGGPVDPAATAAARRVIAALSRLQPLVVLIEGHAGDEVLPSLAALADGHEARILAIASTEGGTALGASRRIKTIRLATPGHPADVSDPAAMDLPRYVLPRGRRGPSDQQVPCPSCGDDVPANARFCIHCGSPIAVARGERRTVTVVFADVRGFGRLSSCRDSAEVRGIAERLVTSLTAVIDAHGGTLDKVISENGLKVMAVFGAPIAHEDDAERAVRAALQMQVVARGLAADDLDLAIGVMTGEAIYALVGPSGRFTVLGDTVNTAARLQAAAARGDVLIGGSTAAGLGGTVALDPVPPIRAKGKVEPVPAWRALAPTTSRRPGRTRPALVGRRDELAALQSAWERARAHAERMLVAVVGSAGVGKSTLIGAFKNALSSDASIHVGHCLPYGEGITYWPLVEVIKDAAGILHDDPADVTSGKLGDLLEGLGIDDLDQLRTIAVAVANLVAAPTTPRGTYQAAEISRAELHWGIRRVFELTAAKRPLLLIFEDLHWAEQTLLTFLEELVAERSAAPMLIVVSARETFVDAYPPLLDPALNRQVISLGPLDAEASAQLLAARIGVSGEAIEPLLEAAAGNPLFLEEIAAMLVDRGVIDTSGRLVGDPSMVSVPSTLRGLIAARIDQLDPAERSAAGHASVIGKVFWDGAVTSIADRDPAPTLRALAERDIVHQMERSTIAGEAEYVFKHILLRDVSYGRIPKAERATMHQRCAAWIEDLPGPPDEFVEFVAYHLEQACRLAQEVEGWGVRPPTLRAVDALMRAARKAENHEGTEEADRYYARALEIMRDGFPETRAEVTLERADTRALIGDLEGSLGLLRDVREVADALGRPDLRCRATLQLANLVATNSADEARALLSEAEELAQQLHDERLLIEQALTSGFLRAIYEGAPAQAISEMEGALVAANSYGETMLRIAAHQRLGNLLMNTGRLADAEHHFTEAAALARQEGSIREETEATRFLATIKFYRGPRAEAERLARQALAWLDRNPNRIVELQTRCRVAWLAISRGALDDASAQLDHARALAERIGGWMKVEVLRNVAMLETLRGRMDEAARAARQARAAVPEGDAYADGAACLAEGVAAASARDKRLARERLTRAVHLLATEPLDQGLACIWFARALASFGDTEQAREMIETARQIYASMDATAMLDDIARVSA
jgi:class 3 adenylate cyclase/tetratricopeptide (TPR) repeat protein